jgi:single-stranded-DNA-specific exonuclease
LVRHGGHAAAAGFTVENENLMVLAGRLKAMAEDTLAGQDLRPTLLIDTEVGLGELNRELYDWLQRMQPFGYDNPVPVFMTRRLRVLGSRVVGTKQDHLKLFLGDGRSRLDAIAFRQAYWFGQLPAHVDVAYYLELNVWNGREQLQLNVQDLRPSE